MATTSSMPRPTPVRPVPPPMNSPERQAAAKEPEAAQQPKPVAPWRLKVGMAVPWIIVIFLTGLVIQVFLAGYGLQELGDQGMDNHVMFAHVIELIPLLLILVAFLGADKASGIGGIVLFVMFQLQYAFVAATASYLRAMHPVNGVLMVALTFGLLLLRVRTHTMKRAPKPAE